MSVCEEPRIGAPLLASAWKGVEFEIAKKQERHARVDDMDSRSLYRNRSY